MWALKRLIPPYQNCQEGNSWTELCQYNLSRIASSHVKCNSLKNFFMASQLVTMLA